MDINRHQVFLVGLVLLFLGVELRMTDSFILNPTVTRMMAEQTEHPVVATSNVLQSVTGSQPVLPPQSFQPPDWIGWFLLSAGAVLVLQSFSMAKP